MSKKRKKRVVFWENEKVVQYFNALCDRATKPSVHWPKFRELDKKGIFSKYKSAHLSLVRRQFLLGKNGLCTECGLREPKIGHKICGDCISRGRKYYTNKKKSLQKEK